MEIDHLRGDGVKYPRRSTLWTLPLGFRCFVLAVPLAAFGLFCGLAVDTPWRLWQLARFLPLVACGLLAIEATRDVKEPRGTLIRDMQAVWFLPIAVLLPPVYGLLAPVPMTLLKLARTPGIENHKRIFSAGALGLSYAVVSVTLHTVPASIAGPEPGSGAHAMTWAAMVTAGGVLGWVLNNTLVVTAVKASDQTVRVRDMLFTGEAATSDLVELSLGVLICLLTAITPVLLIFAVPAALLLRRFVMHAQLLNDARFDGKTGLLNAATWHAEAATEVARAARAGEPVAMALIDIDHFKRVNDTFGHLAGDRVLRALANTLRLHVRDYDLVGRFGGEEFAVLLPRSDEVSARDVAERLRARIAEQSVPAADDGHAPPIQITVSIGIAALDTERAELTELMATADTALYEAKRAGRDQVRSGSAHRTVQGR